MQKLKKALKKLANIGTSKPAQAAKKASSVKKKTAPASASKKAAPKKPAASVAKKAAPKVASKVADKAKPVPAKDLKKKAAAPTPVKAAKTVEKAPVKTAKKTASPAPAAPAPKKVEAKAVEKETPAKAAEPAETVKPVKSKKAREETVREEAVAPEAPEEIVLTDAEGRRYCRLKDCDQIASVDAYCRYHYLLFWKNIQNRKKILTEGKLERYVEELTARYPDKFLELLRKDLRSEKDFLAAIQELEIDEASVDSEYEDEAQSYLEEVRGMSGDSGTGGGGGREEEEF